MIQNFIPGIRAWPDYSFNGFAILIVYETGVGYEFDEGDGYGDGLRTSWTPVFLPEEGHR